MTPDDLLLRSIKQSMLEDGRLSSQPIEVIVDGGQVTLQGAVQAFNRKRAALEIATAIEGVMGVTDRLEVTPPGSLTDCEVAENVRRSLEAGDDVSKEAITVEVSNGVVTLRGNVSTQLQHVLAEDIAIAAAGVRGVYNLLFVNPEEQVEDVGRARDLQTAIGLTEGLQDAAVRAAVAGGVAVVSGSASHMWQRQLAESVAKRMRFLAIRNDIGVYGATDASRLSSE